MKTLDEFLQLLKDFVPSKGGSFKARCPAHADGPDKESWSLSVSQKDDKILVKCFAGCKAADVVKALDLGLADLFLGEKKKKKPAEKTSRTRKQVDKIYPYYDMTGKTLLFEVVRFKPKAFKQRRPDGKGGYIDNLEGVEPVPYRLPQILSAIAAGDTVHFPEGEKDADNLVKLNFQATTSPMGANAWKSKYATFFHGAKLLVIWVDKDIAGRSFARQKALDLIQAAHAVKVIEPPGEKVKDISDWIDAGATAAQIQKLVDDAPLFEAPKDDLAGFNVDLANRDLRNLSADKYSIMDFSFHRYFKSKEDEGWFRLSNFVAKIVEDISKDNGVDQERWLRIRGLRENGSPLKLVMIQEGSFNSMGWVRDKWGVKCRIAAAQSTNEHIRSCTEIISNQAKERMIYTHTGWREINGKMCYLSSNGAIGDPDAECELEGRLGRYALPVPAGDPGESLKVSLAFLNVAKLEVTLPVWTAMYLAPLTPFEDTNFTLWYLGMTGSLKSTIEALALCHFGDFDHKTLPVSWGGTPNEIEHRMFILKDCVTVIDDWAPAADRNLQKEMESKSERILRAQANRAGKVRMRPDLGSQVTFDPRGLVITSGEQLPHGQSRNARLLAVPVEMTDFNMELLTQSQEDKEHYSMAMAHYIAWIQENWEKVRKEIRGVYSDAREKATTEGKHLRLVDIVAAMYSGLHIVLQFMREKKALTETEVTAYLESGWTIFNTLAFHQDWEVNAQSPGRRFLEAIKTQLNSGKAVLRDLNENLEIKPGQTAIGWWAPNGNIYLNPGEAYQMVIQYYSRSGEDFTAYKTQTWQDLRRLQYLECDSDSPTRTSWINGRTVRVLTIIRKYIIENPQQETLEEVK